MNKEAFNYAYDLFVNDGYGDTKSDFLNLLATNKDAVKYAYDLFKNDGYGDTQDDFAGLMGLKTKVVEEEVVEETTEDTKGQPGWSVTADTSDDPKAKDTFDTDLNIDETTEEEVPEMTLEERQRENTIRQGTSYDDWIAEKREDMSFWDHAGENIGDFFGEASSVAGGLFEQIWEMTPLGDGNVEPIDRGWKKKQRRDREQREEEYNAWKYEYDDSILPSNLAGQDTIEGYIEQKINQGEFIGEDGKVVKGGRKNDDGSYSAIPTQVQNALNREDVIKEYNDKRNEALRNKDKRGISKLFGVNISDEFLQDYDINKLTEDELNDPKVQNLLTSLQNLPEKDTVITTSTDEENENTENPNTGIEENIIDSIFNDGIPNGVDEIDFRNWYNTQSKYKGQANMREKFGKKGFTDDYKAEVIQSYLSHKAELLNKDSQRYINLGVPELIDKINSYNTIAENIHAQFMPKYNELNKMKKQFDNGKLKQNQKNVNIYNNLLEETKNLQNQHDNVYNKLQEELTPRNRKLIDGYTSLYEDHNALKEMNLRFLKETSFGKHHNKKLTAQKNRNNMVSENPFWGTIGESVGILWNTIPTLFEGALNTGKTVETKIGGEVFGDKNAEEKALLMSELVDDAAYNITVLGSDEPFTDPITGETNWSRALPNVVRTIRDMGIMIGTGGRVNSLIKSAGRATKTGLLKRGMLPKKLENFTPLAKSLSSSTGVVVGALPIILPQKLEEALSQVDENFTAEDAYEYAVNSTLAEAIIETVNPDFKWSKKSLASIKKGLGKKVSGEDILKAFKNQGLNALKESLKSVPPEILEEFLQNMSNGAFAMSYNNTFDTDFEVPEFAEYKETALLTSMSVLGMRWLRGGLYHSNDQSVLRMASENYDAFVNQLNKDLRDGKITSKKAEELLSRVDGYTIASAEIDDMIYDEDGNVKMSQDQADRLIALITQRNSIQSEIDADPLGPLNEDLEKELENVNQAINNERNLIESETNAWSIAKNDIQIKEIKDKIADPETTKEGKKELRKELAKLEKENKELNNFTPEYSIDGKAYDNKADFLKAVRAAKYNGSLKRGRNLNIKVKNDIEAEKEAYQELGRYAPKNADARVVMTNKQALEAEAFVDKRTELELRTELKKELLKSKSQQNQKKIQQYKDALKYLALKDANYTFGKPGFLVQPTMMSKGDLADLQLEKNIEAVSKATEQFGAKPEVMSQQEVLEKYGPEAAMGNGFFVPSFDSDGNITGFSYVINKDVAKHFKARSVASHEMLHGLLFSIINGPMRKITDPNGKERWVRMTPEGRKLVEGFLKLLPQDQIDILNAKLDKGGYRFNEYDDNGVGIPGTERAFEEYGEEYINMYHDAVVTDKTIPADTEQNQGIIRKIINYFNKLFNRKAPELTNINIQDSQDLFNFLKSYNKQAIEGKFNDQVVELGKRSREAFIPAAEQDRQNEEYQAWLDKEEGAIVPSRSQQPLDLKKKNDLFSKTNQELSEALQAYGIEGEFNPKNQQHLDIWESIPKKDKLFIGYSIGNLWRNYANNKLFAQYGNIPNYDQYEDLILDVLTTGVEVGQNGLPYIVSTWDPTQRKLTSHIWDLLPTRIPHVTRLPQFAGFGKALLAEDQDSDSKIDEEAKKRFKLHERIGIGQGNAFIQDNQRALEINRSVRSVAQTLGTTGLTYKTLKDLRPDLTAEMFGIDVEKLDPNSKKFLANLRIDSQKGTNELLLAQMFINRNASALLHALPEHHTVKMVKNPKTGKLEPRPDKATGVNKVLLEAFYNKGVRKDNLTPWTKKKNVSVKDFLEVMGVVNNKSVRSDRNTSARVQALAVQTGKLLTNQAVREQFEADGKPMEVIRMIGDGRSAFVFSRSQRPGQAVQAVGRMDRSLSDKGKAVLWDRIDEFVNYNILQTSEDSIRDAFAKTYEDVPEIIQNIDKLTNAFYGVISQYNPKVLKQPANLAVKLLETNENQFLKVKEFSGSNITAADAFRDPIRVKKMLATIKMLSNELFDPKNPELSLAKILLMKGHLASSGRNSYLKRKQPLPGMPEFLENTFGSIPGIEYETTKTKDGKTRLSKVTYKGKEIKLPNISSSQASGSALNDTKNSKKINERNKNEDIAGEILNDIVKFYSNLFMDTNQDFDNIDLMMIQASLLSNMSSVLARAAKLKYISDNAFSFKNPGKQLKYEHMQPRVAVLMNMFDAHINGDGITNIKDFLKNYNIAIIPNTMDDVITEAELTSALYAGQTLDMPAWIRYFNEKTRELADGRMVTLLDVTNNMKPLIPAKAWVDSTNILKSETFKARRFNKAIAASRSINPAKGITVFDFDDTLATSKSQVISTSPDGIIRKLTAEEFAKEGADLLEQGWKHDFSEFNKVVEGKVASLFQKALKLQNKFGPENMFVLTARPSESAQSIYEFLKANGLNIPLKNITGLANSTAEAKALWIADKVAEGYNDFYFADDALQNVQAVDNMLEQFDVKRKVQQAKLQFSKSTNEVFNDILEDISGVDSKKRFSAIKARKRGANKGKFRLFIPPSHEDFTGLLYNFIGKGEKGNKHRDFFEEALIKPLNRADRELNAARQSIANDYKQLNKQFPDIRKKLIKKTPDGDFTYQDAIRVYLWNKHGYEIPGLSETDQQNLSNLVASDPELRNYAELVNIISKQDTYVNPTESWEAGDIRTDLDDATGRIGRAQFFSEFIENSDIIFSEENLNKIEAIYGSNVVDAIKDMLYRIKTGKNRPQGQNKLVNRFMNYVNGSVAATMFINMRSVVLQQMSLVNFINYSDNNIYAAAKAFFNQKQYWADWALLFNSDFMKQRRGGIQTDVNGAELAAELRNAQNKPRALIAKLLQFGFTPTQIGDNIAIASGGATYYRNRINTYLKQGLSQKEAEEKAFIDFQVLAEATQQSAKPWMVSMQQASPLGKVILAFQNVTSQFNRLGKKAFLDLYNRRISPEYKNASNPQLQSDMSNLSRIAYYFAIQNLIFYSLQSALFLAMFGTEDEEEDEKFLKKKERMIQGAIDSVLRGTGVWGSAISTLKNMAIKWHEQREKGYNKDESAVLMEMLNVSPPVGIKARKIVNAEKTLNYNKDIIKEMDTFDIDNPMWSAVTNYIEATTNIPVNRMYNKTINIRDSLNNQYSAFKRALMFSGWSRWNLMIEDTDKIKEVKESIKEKKKIKSKKEAKIKKEKKKKEQEEVNKAVIEENKEKSKKDGICAAVSKGGKRCKNKAVNGGFCTVHEKAPQRQDGKQTQCKKIKSDGKRCGMKTSNKSGYCYYHD